tara:strand:+ start:513 stop:1220 length:708 start_codon:yes stop_codon:yes gene_type:complete
MDLVRLCSAAYVGVAGSLLAIVNKRTSRCVRGTLSLSLVAALGYRSARYVAGDAAPSTLRGLTASIISCAVVLLIYISALVDSGVRNALRTLWLGVLVASSVGDGLVMENLPFLPGQAMSDLGFLLLCIATLAVVCTRTVQRHGANRANARPRLRDGVVSALYVGTTATVLSSRLDSVLPEYAGDLFVANVLQGAVLTFAVGAVLLPCAWRSAAEGAAEGVEGAADGSEEPASRA